MIAAPAVVARSIASARKRGKKKVREKEAEEAKRNQCQEGPPDLGSSLQLEIRLTIPSRLPRLVRLQLDQFDLIRFYFLQHAWH